MHLGQVLEAGLHRVAATHQIGDGLVVALYLFALERGAGALHPLHATGGLVAQFRCYGHYSLLLHILLREHAVDGGRHLTGLCFQWIGCNAEIVSRQGAELSRAR